MAIICNITPFKKCNVTKTDKKKTCNVQYVTQIMYTEHSYYNIFFYKQLKSDGIKFEEKKGLYLEPIYLGRN